MRAAAAIALLAPALAADPRLPVVELHLAGQPEAALARTVELRERRPLQAAPLGLSYLEGDLLERLGRFDDAARAFTRAGEESVALAPWARHRRALLREARGEAAPAAVLAAAVLGGVPPAPLLAASARLLAAGVEGGGDCRLLAPLDIERLPVRERRRLQLADARCALRAAQIDRGIPLLLALLDESIEDDVAHAAAEALLATAPLLVAADGRVGLAVARTLHAHREFERAAGLLERLVATPPAIAAAPVEEAVEEAAYLLARSRFWLGDYPRADRSFGELARRAREPERRADALYQQGRSRELAGSWHLAAASYRRAYLADPDGSWAAAGLLAALRLEARQEREREAFTIHRILASRPAFRERFAQASLFLASSDLVRGRADRAGRWLAEAERARLRVAAASRPAARGEDPEIAYWRGRLAELEGEATAAVDEYLAALTAHPYGVFGREATRRLAAGGLAEEARHRGERLAGGRSREDLYRGWLLLGDASRRGAAARRRLLARARSEQRARAYLEIAPVPPARWPLWETPLRHPEERLLALGLFGEGRRMVPRHFPLADLSLALTGAAELARAGEFRGSLLRAQILAERAPEGLPEPLLPEALRRLVHPLPWRDEIVAASSGAAVPPLLLVAIMREESRFDPAALSPASARGLTQFTLPTAQRLAPRVGVTTLAAADLYRPQVAIGLGAAYLAELSDAFGGREAAIVAAYNAGEDQARAWEAHCWSREPAELVTKLGFRETRAYVDRVLRSRAVYEDLYGEEMALRGEEATTGS